MFQSIYFKSLSALKVNRNITKLFRTLPYKFQGLGLPNANIEVLALNFNLLQNHWGTESSITKLLKQAYEVFQTKIGLSGNIFARDYNQFYSLASDGWFKHLWDLCTLFGTNVHINEQHNVPMT